MPLSREEVLRQVAGVVGGRAVRWLPSERAIGDYDGRDRTLEVFDVDARDQRSLLRHIGAAVSEHAGEVRVSVIQCHHEMIQCRRGVKAAVKSSSCLAALDRRLDPIGTSVQCTNLRIESSRGCEARSRF